MVITQAPEQLYDQPTDIVPEYPDWVASPSGYGEPSCTYVTRHHGVLYVLNHFFETPTKISDANFSRCVNEHPENISTSEWELLDSWTAEAERVDFILEHLDTALMEVLL
mgnify:CR=1 FL=1